MALDYAVQHISGVWRLISGGVGTPDWRDSLDRSVDGVFRSFWAILYCAPMMALSLLAAQSHTRSNPELATGLLNDIPLPLLLLINSVSFLVNWAVSIAVIITAARIAGAERKIADAIIVYNWGQVILTAAQTAPFAAVTLFGDPARFFFIPSLAAMAFIYWRVLRQSLGLAIGGTIGLLATMVLTRIIVASIVTVIAAQFIG